MPRGEQAFLASLLVYAVPVGLNDHFVLPWGLMLPFVVYVAKHAWWCAAFVAFGVLAQALAWLLFFLLIREATSDSGVVGRLLVVMPILFSVFFFGMNASLTGVLP